MTFGDLKSSVLAWLREDMSQGGDGQILNDAVNDAIESLWISIALARLEEVMGGPVTNVSFGSAAERVSLVSIANPLVAPGISYLPGGALGVRDVAASFTYVTESGSETLESPVNVFRIPLPAGVSQLAFFTLQAPYVFPPGAVGWNLYADLNGGQRARQNLDPIPITQGFTEPIEGLVFISNPDHPAPPAVNSTGDNIFSINNMEIQTPDMAYKPWDEASLGSEMMRRAGRTLSGTSLYQSYYWDLVTGNGNQLEIRPAAGVTLNPRFFFVQKPRRIKYDMADIPFTGIVSAPGFLRNFAISLIKLANDEYEASEQYGRKAEQERAIIVQSITRKNLHKDDRIIPYLL